MFKGRRPIRDFDKANARLQIDGGLRDRKGAGQAVGSVPGTSRFIIFCRFERNKDDNRP